MQHLRQPVDAEEEGRASGRDPGEVFAGCVRKDHRRGTGPVDAARMVGEHSLAGVGRIERGAGRRIGAGRTAAAVADERCLLALDLFMEGTKADGYQAAQLIALPIVCMRCQDDQLTSGG